MDQPPATTPQAAPTQTPSAADATDAESTAGVGFGARGRMRRRARFLRKARELAYRDIGGLVFNLHRFGQRNDTLVAAKLGTLSHIDAELRALESSLEERLPVTVLREAGVTACPRCAAIHSSGDRFCPNCGLPLSRKVDLPIAGPSASASTPPAIAEGPPAPTHSSAPGTASGVGPGPAGPLTPATAPPTAATGPAAPATGPPTSELGAAPTVQVPGGEDEPTEILHPPEQGRRA